MRTYPIYRDIRKGAVIWGLPLSLFALLMVSVIASLLIIIFSFGVGPILGLLLWNGAFYTGLARWQGHRPTLGTNFPKHIHNKKQNLLHHVQY